jgi:hypothetical protein
MFQNRITPVFGFAKRQCHPCLLSELTSYHSSDGSPLITPHCPSSPYSPFSCSTPPFALLNSDAIEAFLGRCVQSKTLCLRRLRNQKDSVSSFSPSVNVFLIHGPLLVPTTARVYGVVPFPRVTEAPVANGPAMAL